MRNPREIPHGHHSLFGCSDLGRIGGVLFWRSFRRFNGVNGSGLTTVYTAFGVSLALWVAFVIADEIFIAYETANLEGTHMGIFASQLITLLVLRLLPDDGK